MTTGLWSPPHSLLPSERWRYTAAEVYNGEEKPIGRYKPRKQGLYDLQRPLRTLFPYVTFDVGARTRVMRSGMAFDQHQLGRAMDVGIPINKRDSDEVANYLLQNAKRFGLQLIIYKRVAWQCNLQGVRPYSGSDDHTNHVHVELTDYPPPFPALGG